MVYGQDPTPNMAEPDYLDPQATDVPGMTLTRITENNAFDLPDGQARHGYSTGQIFNADETLVDAGNRILDVTDNYAIVKEVPLSLERSWSNINPDIMYGIDNTRPKSQFVRWNVKTGQKQILRNFVDYDLLTMGNYKGQITLDDSKVVLTGENPAGLDVIIAYDIANDEIINEISQDQYYKWAGYSPKGDWIVVYNNNNVPDQSMKRAVRYDPDLTNPMEFTEFPRHGDFAFDDNGEEVFAMISYPEIYYFRLRDGAKVILGSTSVPDSPAGNGHVSGRATNRPGYVYISSSDRRKLLGVYKLGIASNEIIGRHLNGLPVYQGISYYEHWGYSRSSTVDYDSHPKATVSPSGTRFVFTTDWYGRGQTNSYVLEYDR